MGDNNISKITGGQTGFVQQLNQYFDSVVQNLLPRSLAGIVVDGAGSLGDAARNWTRGYFSHKQPFEIGGIPSGGTPAGLMLPYSISSTVAPHGWVFANGETIGKVGSGADHEGEEFRYLFDAYKIIPEYGNSGTEDFDAGGAVKIPNPDGNFVRSMGSVDPDVRTMGSQQSSQNLYHYHTTQQGTGAAAGPSNDSLGSYSGGTVIFHPITSTEGGSESRSNNMAFPYIIKI